MGPWLPYCLYLSARVLVQTLSEEQQDTAQHLDSLDMLMNVLRTTKNKNPYTSTLLMQLERDIAAFGKLNPIGHIVVPMDEVTEVSFLSSLPTRRNVTSFPNDGSQTLEQEKTSAAFSMNPAFGTR